MTASAWMTLGIVLIAAGILVFVLSQLLLSRWHKKTLEELG